MISGTVVALRGAVVPVVVYDVRGGEHPLRAIVDTGYSGWLALPREMIAAMGLPWRLQRVVILGDGSKILVNSYSAKMGWDGRPIAVRVSEVGSEPGIGMRLMHGYRILIEDIDGGAVQIEHM